VRGKAFVRLEEFRKQRGLNREPKRRPPKERGDTVAPPVSDAVWHPLGPAGIPGGQTYGSGTTTVAGRVSSIAVDPDDSKHLLVGAAAGGVWETRDTGATWTPRTDDQQTLSIGAVAFDPNDSSIAYAGTGEANWAYFELGRGILRSDDGGATWSPLAGSDAVFTGQGFYRIVVDPGDSARLIVAMTDRAAVSADAGATWATLHQGETWDVSLEEVDGAVEILLATRDGLLAAVGSAAPAPVALPGLPAKLDQGNDRLAVTHVPSDPGQAFAFAAFGEAAHLWHRPAAGQPFVPIPLPQLSVANRPRDAFSIEQAWYDWYVAAPPQPGGVVYLGAIELIRGRSSTAGWGWSDISSRVDGDSIHPDQHAMAFDPNQPGVIYAGNDGGIFRSADGGETWESLNAGLAISEVEYLAQRPDEPAWLLAGLQDNGTVRREAEDNWTQVGLGDGGDCATNMAHPDTCYSSYVYMSTSRSTERGDRASWEELTQAGWDRFESLFYAPLEVNGDLVVKAGEVVCISADGGDSWASVALPPAAPNRRSAASALAVLSSGRVLAGTRWGDVFQIDADQGGWSAAAKLANLGVGRISDMLADDDLPNRYWVTFSDPGPGAVFRSDDEGASWTDVTANLPQMPVHAIVTDPADRDRVWVACEVGVFESRDAGGSWATYGTGLPNALAADLAFYAPDRLLRVGTRSRGVWEAAVD
jgi:photosystem II stability/assembly factor-like uncharacterized protein